MDINTNDITFNIEELLVSSYIEAGKSLDLSTQVGALLVNESGEILSSGSNNFPDQILNLEYRHKRPDKYLYTEHAERNAIFAAAKSGISTDGLIMVCAWAACADCARAIINSGISCLIRHKNKSLSPKLEKRWNESITVGDLMLKESGICVIEVDPVGGYYLLRDGALFNTSEL